LDENSLLTSGRTAKNIQQAFKKKRKKERGRGRERGKKK